MPRAVPAERVVSKAPDRAESDDGTRGGGGKTDGGGGIDKRGVGNKRELSRSGSQSPEKPLPIIATDGTKPLAAYRRLLAMLYHIRNVRHESGPGYEPLLGKTGSATVVQKAESEFRALEKVLRLCVLRQTRKSPDQRYHSLSYSSLAQNNASCAHICGSLT